MLSTFIRTESGRRRYLKTPFGPYLNGYLSHRRDRGFALATVVSDLKWAAAFGEYLARRRGVSIDRLAENHLDAFVAHYRRHPRRRGPARRTASGSVSLIESARGSIRSLLAYLRSIGATAPAPPASAPTPYDAVLSEYLTFLRVHRGFAERTIELHRHWASAFFAQLGRRSPRIDLAVLGIADVEAATMELREGRGRRQRQIMTTTIRALLRFLRGTGKVPRSCVPFLPQMKTYALSSLPSTIAWNDVERTIASMDTSSGLGQRDYAMVMLAATYGLRSAEVVNLRLDDFDWRHGIIHVRQSKTRRTLDLPLLPAVRDAIIAYVRDGRGMTSERRVFLKIHAPLGPVTGPALYQVVRKTLKRAGVEAAHFGPHALRHARATSWIRAGESLKTIGDLLGHRVPEATLMYCKVALEDLRSVALEIPGVTP